MVVGMAITNAISDVLSLISDPVVFTSLLVGLVLGILLVGGALVLLPHRRSCGPNAVFTTGRLTVDTTHVISSDPQSGAILYAASLNDGREVAAKWFPRSLIDVAKEEIASQSVCGEHNHLIEHFRWEKGASGGFFLAETLCVQTLLEWCPSAASVDLRRVLFGYTSALRHLHTRGVVYGTLDSSKLLVDAFSEARLQLPVPVTRSTDQKLRSADIVALGNIFKQVHKSCHASEPLLRSLSDHMAAGDFADISSVCSHPYFWSTTARSQFIFAVSAALEASPASPPVSNSGRRLPLDVLAGRETIKLDFNDCMNNVPTLSYWIQRLPPALLDDSAGTPMLHDSKTRNKNKKKGAHVHNGPLVSDLLRLVRNRCVHFGALPPQVRRSLGNTPEGAFCYFEDMFPDLFVCTFEFFRHAAAKDLAFDMFFNPQRATSLVQFK